MSGLVLDPTSSQEPNCPRTTNSVQRRKHVTKLKLSSAEEPPPSPLLDPLQRSSSNSSSKQNPFAFSPLFLKQCNRVGDGGPDSVSLLISLWKNPCHSFLRRRPLGMHHTPTPHHHWVLLVQDVPLPPLRHCFLSGQFCSPP